MNREIKFRAWDNLQNKFLFPYPDGFDILGETTCFDLIGQQLKAFTPNKTTLERLNDVEITQFTGLKDKNGKEIYEGDIVVYGNDEPQEVVFKNQQFCISFEDYGEVTLRVFDDQNKWRVIGNIYENPERYKNV